MNPQTSPDQDDPTPTFRAGIALCVLLAGAGLSVADDARSDGENSEVATPSEHTAEKIVVTPLLSTTSLDSDDWVFVSKEKDSKLTDTWQLTAAEEDPVLICKGLPYGYLRTNQQYDNFEMELEWRFPTDENGNSGILLHTAEDDKVWPKSIQVQLHQPVAGSIFPSGDAKSDNEIRDVRHVARPINEWNVCRISSTGGTISVEMNGKKVGEVTGCQPNKGWIALQSEGSEVHFRRIRIRQTPPVAAPMPRVEQSTGWLSRPCVDEWWITASDVCDDPRFLHVHHHSDCRDKRRRKVSHVVYRDPLAADDHLDRGGDCLWVDVAGAANVAVAGWGDRLRRADRRRLGF